ncbi:hypothetical protein BLNAU_3354 [Blattamonas nauphoetae]|uniref:Uncharacterized protein n=1 Tax=Blattamonas nauphoetae TaxID=2049346 RepID=A0ABQ9YCR6_9EUKA|nr:hypothetical protein BLNAU_3354 [Blattamonas nauphoetae]
MIMIDKKKDTSSSATHSDYSCPDCSPFLNWTFLLKESEQEKAVVFRSLVATVKIQPALDASLEAKAVSFLKFVIPAYMNPSSVEAFLDSLGRTTDESLTNFIQSIVVLLSSPNRAIAKATMEMVAKFVTNHSVRIRIPLVKADLIPQLIFTLNPLSLSFTEAADIHSSLMNIIHHSVWLATPDIFRYLKIKDYDEQQALYEMVVQQILAPSEQYICHLCVNRYSIIDGEQSGFFLELLANLLQISAYYQPTMDFVVNMPVFFTIPSCLIFFENDDSLFDLLCSMVNEQRVWNKQGGEYRQMWKTVHRMLRMEGIEDAIEEQLQSSKTLSFWKSIVGRSMAWNNILGMNLPKQE